MQVEPEFIAKTAVYARERAHMKDMPALLCAVLAVRDTDLLAAVFPRVIDSAKMLRSFVQIVRSGVTGRKSLGTRPRRLVREWLAARPCETLFRQSVGTRPSLGDVIKMVHPTPDTEARRSLYGYLVGKRFDVAKLPDLVAEYEAFKAGHRRSIPDVPFQLLTSLPLTQADWTEIALKASWQMTRMNLNTFSRHGVFNSPEAVTQIAARLGDRAEVQSARAFPYQLLAAYYAATGSLPAAIGEALQDALEHSTANVPVLPGKVYVLLDVSGSMASPVTGHRQGATSAVRCIDAAALIAACVLRNNPSAQVIPFERDVVTDVRLNPRDSVMTNAKMLASIGGGGTDCSAPLRWLNDKKQAADTVVFVSDNESWVDARRGPSAVMLEWRRLKQRSPKAKLACIDLVPNSTTQAQESADILNVGGFSDAVFDVVGSFAAGASASGWVAQIRDVRL